MVINGLVNKTTKFNQKYTFINCILAEKRGIRLTRIFWEGINRVSREQTITKITYYFNY